MARGTAIPVRFTDVTRAKLTLLAADETRSLNNSWSGW